jgi:dethiobiotin synthetase
MDGVFVTGTDTGVGKTTVAAGLLKLMHGTKKVAYWKPVQTGTIVGDDTETVKELTGLPSECFVEATYRFPEPISPYHAATKWGKKIELDALEKVFITEKRDKFLIVEGAGGIMVPLGEGVLQIELIKRLKLPLLIVAEDRVGTINHTILTLSAARKENIPILGVVLTRSRKNLGNAESIAVFGKVRILAELDNTEDSKSVLAQVGTDSKLREMLSVDHLPD